MSDRFEDEPRPRTPTEGVRILGAEEAQAAIDARTRAERNDDAGDPDPQPERRGGAADELDLIRPERFADDGPTWAASAAGSEPATGEEPALPHWTEPPTGAVPAIFADDAADDAVDDLDAWSGTGVTPRFRAEGSDWAVADFAAEDLSDEAARPGSLAEAQVIEDDDATFERDITERQRRVPRGRAARTMTTGSPVGPNPPVVAPPSAAGTIDPGPVGGPAGDAATETPPDRAGATSVRRRRSERPPSEPGDRPPAGAAPGRDLPTAVVTAAVVAVVALICFTQGTFWTVLFVALIVGAGTLEFTTGLQARGFRPAAALALTAAALLPIAAREFGPSAYPVFFGLVVIFSLLWFLWEITPGRPLLAVATTVLSFAYVGGLGGFGGLLLASADGVGLILGVVLCVVTYDIVGFFVGSQFGKSPIAPRVSPNKSFEGTLAGMIGAVAMGWLFVGGAIFGGIAPWSPGRGAVLGLFVAAGAFLGDLCESMLKRDLGIKDFGSLLPGHGGILDRFDSILFCLPITYYLAAHLNIL